MIVGQVCNPFVVTIEVGQSVFEAAKLMREHHVGSLIVVEDGGEGLEPRGIITDRDIVIGLVAKEITDLRGLDVEEVITRALVTVDETDTLSDAAELMRENGVRRLPVTDGEGRLSGILTLDDALGALTDALDDLVAVGLGQGRRERELRP